MCCEFFVGLSFSFFLTFPYKYQEPDLHPEPGLGDHQVPDRSLATVEGELLILKEGPFSFFPTGLQYLFETQDSWIT